MSNLAVGVTYVPQSRSRSEQEIMAENGGHIYQTVHLAECAACRAEFERRKKQDREETVIAMCIVIPIIMLVAVYIYESEAGSHAWLWLPWNKKRRLEVEAEDRKWRNYYR